MPHILSNTAFYDPPPVPIHVNGSHLCTYSTVCDIIHQCARICHSIEYFWPHHYSSMCGHTTSHARTYRTHSQTPIIAKALPLGQGSCPKRTHSLHAHEDEFSAAASELQDVVHFELVVARVLDFICASRWMTEL